MKNGGEKCDFNWEKGRIWKGKGRVSISFLYRYETEKRRLLCQGKKNLIDNWRKKKHRSIFRRKRRKSVGKKKKARCKFDKNTTPEGTLDLEREAREKIREGEAMARWYFRKR